MRDDDVLVPSREWSSPLGRFQQIHEMIGEGMLHVPTLLVEELSEFPECVAYIREETARGRMLPELHGMMHCDYGKLDAQHVAEHLEEALEWIEGEIGRRPERWYTPWGATQEHLHQVAAEFGLEVVGVDRDRILANVTARLREGRLTLADVLDGEISFHWWEKGARVARIAAVVRHGSWEAAALAERELFR